MVIYYGNFIHSIEIDLILSFLSISALSYPENPPQIDFNQYKSKVANKDLVQKLEQAYKSMKIVYPTDTERGAEIAKQEAEHKKQCESYIPVANGKIAEAQALV